MAATEDKLIERVTDGSLPPDYEFIDTLLLTFRSFMRPAEFFDRLVARFNAELPENAKPDDVQYFEKVKGPTQLRCIVTLEWWIEHYFQDFARDKELRDDLADIVVQISGHPSYVERANRLKGLIETKLESYESLETEHSAEVTQRKSNRKSMESMVSLTMFTPEDLAQQLCLHDFELFRRIEPIEYLNQILQKTDDDDSPWLDKFILLFDKTSYWAATEICLAKEKKVRIKVLEHLILLAKACLQYGNFFTMFALIAGLALSPVSRLKATWESLPKQTRTVFDDLEKIADPSKNMKNYRDRLQQASPPIVPFLPIYLKDLTFINDGNELRLFGIMINFDKLRMMARRVRDIADMANFEYPFESKPVIMNYLNNATINKDLAALKEMSLECEPKT